MADKRLAGSVPTNYASNFGVCRDLRHSWHWQHWDLHGGSGGRVLICPTCETRREEVWESYQIVKRTYKYSRGYELAGSRGKRGEIMMEIHRRLLRLVETGKLQTRALPEKRAGVA